MKKIINKYLTFIKYIFSAGISFAIDLSLFTLFNYLLRGSLGLSSIIVATVLARIISSCINYLMNRNKVFNQGKDGKKLDSSSFAKYVALVISQMFVSSFAVTYLYNLTGVNESIIKILVDCVLFFFNFFIQKKFIFNSEKREKKEKSNVVLFIYAILSSSAFVYNPINTVDVLKLAVSGNVLILTVLTILIYLFYRKYYNEIRRYKLFNVLSELFTIFMVFGYSFYVDNSANLVYGDIQYVGISLVKMIGYYVFFDLVLCYLYDYIDKLKIKKIKLNKYIKYFDEHPFKVSFIFLGVIFLIYFIAFYPGVVGYDPSYQIKEVMGIPNFYTEGTIITGKTLITQFNPVLHTLLLGLLFKFGASLGNVNLGIAIYTIIQSIALISVLSYSIKFMHSEKVNLKILIGILLIYGFVPVFPFYSISAFKDTYFAMFFILFVIQVYKYIKYDVSYKDVIILVLCAIGVCAFRHNGFITVLISCASLLLANKNNRKYILISILALVLVHFGYKGILTHFEVAPTSIREVLSVPLQQTARLVVEDEDAIADEDKLAIDKIINYSKIKENYNPELSDPIKNTFRINASDEDIKNYFGVWIKYLFKKPLVYVDATTNNIYGYFYPNAQNWYFYHYKYNVLNDVGFDYHYNSLEWLRGALVGYGFAFQYIPVLNLFVSIGFTAWIYMFIICALIIKNKKKYIVLLVPSILIILMCVVGPVNTYYRYVLPYAFVLPMICGVLYTNIWEEKKNNG